MRDFDDHNAMAGIANVVQALASFAYIPASLGAAAKKSSLEAEAKAEAAKSRAAEENSPTESEASPDSDVAMDSEVSVGSEAVSGEAVSSEADAEVGGEVVADAGVAEGLGAVGAALVPLAPLAIPLLIVIGIAGVWAALSQDSELEKWTKHGPFAKDESDRMSHAYGKLDKKEQAKEVYAALATLLQSPQVLLKEDRTSSQFSDGEWNHDIVAEIYAPGWTPGKGILDLRATLEGHTATESAIEFFGGENGEPMQEEIFPYDDIEWIRADKTGPVIGMRYRYRGRPGSWQYRARGRYITPDGITLPSDIPGSENSGKPDERVRVENDVPGWAYPKDWLDMG